jgi:shikimate dehydrogenase
LRAYGIPGAYTKEAISPENFAAFVRALAARGYCGANVTLPHKLEAWRLCDGRDAAADAIGAVNTLWVDKDRLFGSNTDAFGFLASLDAGAPGWDGCPGSAVVIGAGGAARAVVWALGQRGFGDIRIVNRTFSHAEELAAAFPGSHAFSLVEPGHALNRSRLLVNTSSLGMIGSPALTLDLRGLDADAVICDIVYRPLETPLLSEARRRGSRAVDGLGMLMHQAVPGFEKWFGVRPQVTPDLRAACIAALAAAEGTSS